MCEISTVTASTHLSCALHAKKMCELGVSPFLCCSYCRIVFCIYKGATDFTTNDGITGGYYVRVSAPTLFISLLILFGMIALVIGTIILNKWKLTKGLG